MSDILSSLSGAIIRGDSGVQKLVKDALDDGISAKIILEKGLLAGMQVVGKRFKDDEMFIPEVLQSAEIMSEAMKILEPIFSASKDQKQIKMAVGTVYGDIHDIGKNMVITLLRGAGYIVSDLGINLPAEVFVDEVAKGDIKVLGLSALLTTTAPYLKTVIEALEKTGVRSKVKVIVGGAAVTQSFAEDIGADLYAPDAISAVEVVTNALGTYRS